MKVTEKIVDALNIELTVEVAPEDYAAAEKKKLAERRRTADFKGFRKGNVPASLIQRVYGEQCLVDAVNEVVSAELQKYLSESGKNFLGEPLGSGKQPDLEWKSGNGFSFIFDLAVAPEVSVEASKDDVVNEYNITVAAKDKTDMIANLKKYYEEKKEERTDEQIDEEVTSRLQDNYKRESAWRLNKDIRDYFVNKAGLQLPEEFLKRWLFTANEGKFSKEDIEKEFAGFAEDFKWQMVRGFFMGKFGLKVGDADIQEAAKAFVTYQYAMYGIGNVPEEMIAEAVTNVLKDRKQIERLTEQVEDEKVMSRLKEEITVKAKKISSEKFRAL